jgi:hypothetical protein
VRTAPAAERSLAHSTTKLGPGDTQSVTSPTGRVGPLVTGHVDRELDQGERDDRRRRHRQWRRDRLDPHPDRRHNARRDREPRQLQHVVAGPGVGFGDGLPGDDAQPREQHAKASCVLPPQRRLQLPESQQQLLEQLDEHRVARRAGTDGDVSVPGEVHDVAGPGAAPLRSHGDWLSSMVEQRCDQWQLLELGRVEPQRWRGSAQVAVEHQLVPAIPM